MKLLRLPRAQVRLGQTLPWNVRDEAGTLLLSKGHLVVDEKLLNELLERGAFVDEVEARAVAAEVAAAKLLISSGDPAKSVGKDPSLFEFWDNTTETLKALLAHPGSEPDFPGRVQAFAQHLVQLFDSNPDIAIYRAVRQDNAQNFYYGYTHAVLTAMTCILISRHLGWPQTATMTLVKAALTMNMTIFELQGQMAAQDHPPRDKQRAALLAHPTQARELLEKNGVNDAAWLDAVVQHHEHADGTGYPTGCTEVGEMASVLRAADVLMAKIAPRTLHPCLAPKEAITQLYRDDKGGPLSAAVVKELGVYPPGDFVKLASGELGIVVERTANARAPIVASITDCAGKPVPKTVRHDTAQAAYAIVGAASDKTLLKRLAPERLYGFASASVAPAP
ncbi:MAG: phosphohydrolase [Burkholderiales bacterium]|nr:phosphohydrolase [Burkholderiales bacterium]